MEKFINANRQLSTVIVQAQQYEDTVNAANELLDNKLAFDTCNLKEDSAGLWLCSVLGMYKAASNIDAAAVEATGNYIKSAYKGEK